MTSPIHSTLTAALSGVFLLTSLTACQPSSSSDSGESASPSESASASPAQVFQDDFAQVCNAVPLASAASYEKTAGTHPILVFTRADASSEFMQSFGELPTGWILEWQQAKDTQLVACLTIASRQKAKSCEFEPDEGKTEKYILELYDTRYDVTLYAAKTGEKLDEATFDLKADSDCPTFNMFTEGEQIDQRDADFDQPLLDFIKPYVQPQV